MDVTISSAELSRALAAAEKVVSRRPTLPVLGNVLVRATEGTLTVSATDTELAMVSQLPAQCLEDGVVTLPSSTLSALVRSLPPTDVRLSETKSGVAVTASGFKATLQTLPHGDFPTIPSPGDVQSATVPRAWLRSAALSTRFATKEGDTRFFLGGALFEVSEQRTRMVATDSYRMAIADGVTTGATLPNTILPTKTLYALGALLDGDGDSVRYVPGDNHLFFVSGSHMLVSRVIDGKYPQYERVIPKVAAQPAEVDRETLLAALRRSALVMDATTKRAVFTLAKGSVKVATQSASVGDSSESVESPYDGETMEVGLNVDYVRDFAEAAVTQRVSISVVDPKSGVTLQSVGGDLAYRYTLMPVVL